MKRTTAIRHAKEISANLRGLGGIIATPGCEHEAYKVDRLWVFGSTSKGAANPTDLDLLIQGREIGHRGAIRDTHRSYFINGRFRRKLSGGRQYVPRSIDEAFMAIVGRRRMVRIHEIDYDGRIAWSRVMLYPRDETALLVDPALGLKHAAGKAFTFGQTWRSPKGLDWVVSGYEIPEADNPGVERMALLTASENGNRDDWWRTGSRQKARDMPETIKRPCTAVRGWTLWPHSDLFS